MEKETEKQGEENKKKEEEDTVEKQCLNSQEMSSFILEFGAK